MKITETIELLKNYTESQIRELGRSYLSVFGGDYEGGELSTGFCILGVPMASLPKCMEGQVQDGALLWDNTILKRKDEIILWQGDSCYLSVCGSKENWTADLASSLNKI